MKNMSKRNKMFLGISGGIIVLAVLVVVFFQVSEGGLFGASIIEISPNNTNVRKGTTLTLNAHTSYSKCSWSTSNSAIATISGSGRTAILTGKMVGPVGITVKCGAFSLSSGHANETVIPKPYVDSSATPLTTVQLSAYNTTGKLDPESLQVIQINYYPTIAEPSSTVKVGQQFTVYFPGIEGDSTVGPCPLSLSNTGILQLVSSSSPEHAYVGVYKALATGTVKVIPGCTTEAVTQYNSSPNGELVELMQINVGTSGAVTYSTYAIPSITITVTP